MNIKRFFASDTRKALNMVRETLGAEAIIISNRNVGNGVEILAAEDFDEELSTHGEVNTANATVLPETLPKKIEPIPQENNAFAESIKREIQKQEEAYNPKANSDEKQRIHPPHHPHDILPTNLFDIRRVTESNAYEQSEQQSVISSMREEISKLRGMMEKQFSKAVPKKEENPIRDTLQKQFLRIGLNNSLAGALVNTMQNIDELTPQMATREALALLSRQIRTSNDDILTTGGIVVLLGSAGSGKTTTLAKLASQFIQRHLSKDIILVSTDTVRIGAQEQLLAYGQLLGIPVLKAKDQNEINQILSAVGDKKLVLVDSASLTQNDLMNPKSLPTMQTGVKNVKHYLVMPASMQTATLEHIVASLSTADVLEAGIITKVDDSVNLGSALSAAIQHKLPIAYWSDGQDIASHLHTAKPQNLISKAVTMIRNVSRAPEFTVAHTMNNAKTTTSNHVQ